MSEQVQKMFDGIAHKYDFLNHFLSAGRDIRWRKKAIRYLKTHQLFKTENNVLDVCGGTGDFLLETASVIPVNKGIVLDFSRGMLNVCAQKFKTLEQNSFGVVQADALHFPLDEKYSLILNAFGMRNLDDTSLGIQEVSRFLEEKGVFITLEFFRPSHFFPRFFYESLAPLFIPLFGAVFSGKKEAYEYLIRSIRGFKTVPEYQKMIESHQMKVLSVMPCDFGIAHIVIAQKI
jgi:demethylmenaquinone methyltransferase / 2-methoxy-6-polyprenyl-1,4-benzoquinol methylase